MTAIEDRELADWQADWQGDRSPGALEHFGGSDVSPKATGPTTATIDSTDPIAALRRRLRRRTIGLALVTATEIAITAGILTLLAGVARRTPPPLDLVMIASLALLGIAAQAWALWNRRGLWQAQGESALAFIDFSILRCRRRLNSVRFGAGLLAAETFLFLLWFFLNPAAWSTFALGLLATCVAVAATALALFGRYSRRELTALSKLRAEVAGE